jgi:hypothetical protein
MKYLHEKNCPVGPTICYDAIPHLDCLQYSFEVLNAPLNNSELEHAVQTLSEECLKYLIDKGVTWPDGYHKWGYPMETFAEMLAESGEKIRELKLAIKYQCELDENVCAAAAGKNDVYLLKFLHENGCPWDAGTTQRAVDAKAMECLKYAHENGCAWNFHCCSLAAKHRSTTVLEYLYENGCPTRSDTIYSAAEKKSFECLKFAHEHGCEWHPKTLTRAVVVQDVWNFSKADQITESVKILQYARERGCPWNDEVAVMATMTGNLPALKWLHENGAPWPAAICKEAINSNQKECLEYIHSQDDCPYPKCYKSKSYVPRIASILSDDEEGASFDGLF